MMKPHLFENAVKSEASQNDPVSCFNNVSMF